MEKRVFRIVRIVVVVVVVVVILVLKDIVLLNYKEKTNDEK
jgi:hypothetical protein